MATLPSVGNSSSSATSETETDTGDDDDAGAGECCADFGEITAAAAETSIAGCVMADTTAAFDAWIEVEVEFGFEAGVSASAGAADGEVGVEVDGACFGSLDGDDDADDDDGRLEASVGESDRADDEDDGELRDSTGASVAAAAVAVEVSCARNCSASWFFGCKASARSSEANASLALSPTLPSAVAELMPVPVAEEVPVADIEPVADEASVLMACRARARR